MQLLVAESHQDSEMMPSTGTLPVPHRSCRGAFKQSIRIAHLGLDNNDLGAGEPLSGRLRSQGGESEASAARKVLVEVLVLRGKPPDSAAQLIGVPLRVPSSVVGNSRRLSA